MIGLRDGCSALVLDFEASVVIISIRKVSI